MRVFAKAQTRDGGGNGMTDALKASTDTTVKALTATFKLSETKGGVGTFCACIGSAGL